MYSWYYSGLSMVMIIVIAMYINYVIWLRRMHSALMIM